MTDSLPEPPQIDPAALAGTTFSRGRRGFDPVEVNSALGRAADAIRTWELRDRQLRAHVESLEQRLSESRELDEQRIASVLGEETARIITTAREAAVEIRTKAEDQAARLLKESEESATARAVALEGEASALRDEARAVRDAATADSERLLSESRESAANLVEGAERRHEELISTAQSRHDELLAQGQTSHDELVAAGQARHDELVDVAARILGERTKEAEEAAAAMVAEGAAMLAAAEVDSQIAREAAASDAAAELERARNDGRAMVAEAKEVRERILTDLAERRRIARQQIEGTRVGRDAIIELLQSAGTELSEIVESLQTSDGEVQRSAEDAATALDDDTEAFLSEIDAELGIDHFELIDVEADGSGGPEALEPEAVEAEVIEAEVIEIEVTEIEVAEVETIDREPEVGGPDAAEHEVTGTEGSLEAASEILQPEVVASSDVDLVEFVEISEPGSAMGSEAAAGPEDAASAVAMSAQADVDHDDSTNVVGIFSGASDLPDESESVALSADDSDLEDEDDDDEDGDEYAAELADLKPTVESEQAEIDITVGASEPVTVDSSGATVHDLFARIRAEGLSESEPAGQADQPSEQNSAVALDDLSAVLNQRDALLVPVEKQLLRALRRLASDEQNETLDKLRRVKRGRPEAELVLADVDESAIKFTAVLIDDFTAAVEAGISFWSQTSGTSADPLFEDSERTSARLQSIVQEFIAVHRAHLDKAFSDAEEAGMDTAELGDSLSASYRDWRSKSLNELAGDLATAGFAHGERIAAGPGTPWRWIVDNGGLPCADGEDNALAGAVLCEEPFPTGNITPPAHTGCRCMLIPAHQ